MKTHQIERIICYYWSAWNRSDNQRESMIGTPCLMAYSLRTWEERKKGIK